MCVCVCICVFKFFSEIPESTEAKLGWGRKIYSNDSGQLLFILILSASGGCF